MTPSLFRRVRVGAILAIVVVPACSLFQRQGGSTPLSDRDVAAIFLAANNTDVSYAQVALAPGRTSNADVIAFANRMLSDHGGLNRSALDLFSSTGITPRDNTISLDFRDESAAKRDTLREHNGALFDSVYMASEVRYHTRLLVAIDSVLLPATRHAELKALLTRVRPAVAAHLEHATRIQAGLGK
jgi:putative membrane protein